MYKIFKQKKGMELSINFIVMLVLAIAVFSGGLMFANKFFRQAGDTKAVLDSQAQRQIAALLDDGSPVVLPISTKEIRRSKHDTFGLGVLNVEDAQTFTVGWEFLRAVELPPGRATLCNVGSNCDSDPTTWITQGKDTFELKRNEKTQILFLVDVPSNAERGNYIYKITVKRADQSTYDFPIQMIVKVP